jgi:hypothetical protein
LLVKLVICFFRHPILRSTPLSWKKSVDCLLPPYRPSEEVTILE